MENKKYHVIGIGNPLLDFIFNVKDSLLNELGLKKGEFSLIDKQESKEILEKLKDKEKTISPGGSAANMLSGISFLGGNTAQIGKIGKDNHGEIYESKTREQGIF